MNEFFAVIWLVGWLVVSGGIKTLKTKGVVVMLVCLLYSVNFYMKSRLDNISLIKLSLIQHNRMNHI